MFGKKSSITKELKFAAWTSSGSASGYLEAAALSSGRERAGFLVLCYRQAAVATMLWHRVLQEDEKMARDVGMSRLAGKELGAAYGFELPVFDPYQRAVDFENAVATELLMLADKGVQKTNNFPESTALAKEVSSLLEAYSEEDMAEYEPRVGFETAWADPLSNVREL